MGYKQKKESRSGVVNVKSIFTPDTLVGKKADKEEAVTKMTVTISTGKTFDSDPAARMNMISAILASEFLNQTSTNWRLADNTMADVTLVEIKEANAIALQTFGQIIGV